VEAAGASAEVVAEEVSAVVAHLAVAARFVAAARLEAAGLLAEAVSIGAAALLAEGHDPLDRAAARSADRAGSAVEMAGLEAAGASAHSEIAAQVLALELMTADGTPSAVAGDLAIEGLEGTGVSVAIDLEILTTLASLTASASARASDGVLALATLSFTGMTRIGMAGGPDMLTIRRMPTILLRMPTTMPTTIRRRTIPIPLTTTIRRETTRTTHIQSTMAAPITILRRA